MLSHYGSASGGISDLSSSSSRLSSLASTLLTTLLLLSAATPSTAVFPDPNGLRTCLTKAGVAYVDSSSGSSYSSAIKPFNQRLQYSPIAVATPKDASQVASLVNCGRDAGYYINARSGGHSYAAMALGGENGHLVADLKNMQQVTVNGERATIGGGSHLGDVGLALNAKGRALATGVCPFVGIGGHGGYGGFGFFSRSWGLVVDQLRSVEIVTADGQIRNVSATSADSDLFWAVRGAAGSYGIVTKFEVNTHAAPSSVIYATYTYNDLSPNAFASLMTNYQTFSSSSSLSAGFASTLNIFKGSKQNTISVSFTMTYLGASSQQAFLNAIQPLVSTLPAPSSRKVSQQGWKDTLQLLAGNQNLNTTIAKYNYDTFYAKSIMTPSATPLTASALSNWAGYLATTGYSSRTNWFIQVELYGGVNSAINKVKAADTAFVHRSSLFTIQYYASSSNYGPPYPQDGITFVNGMVTSLTNPMGSSYAYEAYQNYIDPQLSTADAQRLYYGSNYARLQGIKRTYDPRNVFKVGPSQAIAG